MEAGLKRSGSISGQATITKWIKRTARAMWEKIDKTQKSFTTLFTSLSKTQKKRSAFFFFFSKGNYRLVRSNMQQLLGDFRSTLITQLVDGNKWNTKETKTAMKKEKKKKKQARKSIMCPMSAHWWSVYSRRITNKLFKSPPRRSQRGISLCSTPWHWFLPVAKDWDAWRLDTHTHTHTHTM